MQVSTFNSKYLSKSEFVNRHYASEYCINALSFLTGRLRRCVRRVWIAVEQHLL